MSDTSVCALIALFLESSTAFCGRQTARRRVESNSANSRCATFIVLNLLWYSGRTPGGVEQRGRQPVRRRRKSKSARKTSTQDTESTQETAGQPHKYRAILLPEWYGTVQQMVQFTAGFKIALLSKPAATAHIKKSTIISSNTSESPLSAPPHLDRDCADSPANCRTTRSPAIRFRPFNNRGSANR